MIDPWNSGVQYVDVRFVARGWKIDSHTFQHNDGCLSQFSSVSEQQGAPPPCRVATCMAPSNVPLCSGHRSQRSRRVALSCSRAVQEKPGKAVGPFWNGILAKQPWIIYNSETTAAVCETTPIRSPKSSRVTGKTRHSDDVVCIVMEQRSTLDAPCIRFG